MSIYIISVRNNRLNKLFAIFASIVLA